MIKKKLSIQKQVSKKYLFHFFYTYLYYYQFTTVEYELQTNPVGPPVFLFVVDTCVDEDELAHLRDALQQTLNLLPEDALVGLITFGTLVHVHELGFTDCPKSYVFRGEKEYPPQKVQDMLGVTPIRSGPGNTPGGQSQGMAGGMKINLFLNFL